MLSVNYCIGYLYEDSNQTPTLASYEASGTSTSFRLESNVRGDVVALRDASGNVFARYTYGEYGVLKGVAVEATDQISQTRARDIAQRQPLSYAGYVYDDYSQMYYCAARYYDPATQVFVSLDPARADGERSGYLYCDGDPVNHADPSGLRSYVFAYDGRSDSTLLHFAKNCVHYDESKVTYRVVNTKAQFFTKWNNLSGTIDDIYLFVHGGAGCLYFLNQTFPANRIKARCQKKSIKGNVYMFVCHGSSKGKKNPSVAGVLANRTGKKVWATKSGVNFFLTKRGYLPYTAGIYPFKWYGGE